MVVIIFIFAHIISSELIYCNVGKHISERIKNSFTNNSTCKYNKVFIGCYYNLKEFSYVKDRLQIRHFTIKNCDPYHLQTYLRIETQYCEINPQPRNTVIETLSGKKNRSEHSFTCLKGYHYQGSKIIHFKCKIGEGLFQPPQYSCEPQRCNLPKLNEKLLNFKDYQNNCGGLVNVKNHCTLYTKDKYSFRDKNGKFTNQQTIDCNLYDDKKQIQIIKKILPNICFLRLNTNYQGKLKNLPSTITNCIITDFQTLEIHKACKIYGSSNYKINDSIKTDLDIDCEFKAGHFGFISKQTKITFFDCKVPNIENSNNSCKDNFGICRINCNNNYMVKMGDVYSESFDLECDEYKVIKNIQKCIPITCDLPKINSSFYDRKNCLNGQGPCIIKPRKGFIFKYGYMKSFEIEVICQIKSGKVVTSPNKMISVIRNTCHWNPDYQDKIISYCIKKEKFDEICGIKRKSGYILEYEGQLREFIIISCRHKKDYKVHINRCVYQSTQNANYLSHNCLEKIYEKVNENDCSIICDKGYHRNSKASFKTSCAYTSESGTPKSILKPSPECFPYECPNPITNFEKFRPHITMKNCNQINEHTFKGHCNLFAQDNHTFVIDDNQRKSMDKIDLFCKDNNVANILSVEVKNIVCKIDMKRNKNIPPLIIKNSNQNCWRLSESETILHFISECEIEIPRGYALQKNENDLIYNEKTISCFKGESDIEYIEIIEINCFVRVTEINLLKLYMIGFDRNCKISISNTSISKKSVAINSICKVVSNENISIIDKNGRFLKEKTNFCKKQNEVSPYSFRVEACRSPKNTTTLFFDNLCGVRFVGEVCFYRCKEGYHFEPDHRLQGIATCSFVNGSRKFTFSESPDCKKIQTKNLGKQSAWYYQNISQKHHSVRSIMWLKKHQQKIIIGFTVIAFLVTVMIIYKIYHKLLFCCCNENSGEDYEDELFTIVIDE